MDCSKCPFNKSKGHPETNALFYIWIIHYYFKKEIENVENPKHQVELKQELDMFDHYIKKAFENAHEIKSYLKAFGSRGDRQ